MNNEQRQRRALTHVGGAIRSTGDAEPARLLAHALDVASSADDEDSTRAHVHGFHSYPARMHPETAGRLVAAFSPEGGRVLDPFCGSGTVLVEALQLGRSALGVDLNPLAIRLARCKTRPRTEAESPALLARAAEVSLAADERRKARAGASRRLPDDDVKLFEPHVLLELDSLRVGIETTKEEGVRADLWLVLSAILVKLSRKVGDTSQQVSSRRTAPGFAAKMFLRKTEELVQRLAEFRSMLPTPLPVVKAEQDDATKLQTVRETVDAIVTSPPYAATYNYATHHQIRMRWLALDPRPLLRGELGSRGAYREIQPEEAPAVWGRELGQFLTAAARVLRPGGALVLVLADSAVGKVPIRADEIVAKISREHGFTPIACASQARPHFHAATKAAFRFNARSEHAILLRRQGKPGK